MALIRDLSTAQLAFQIAGGEPDQFTVVRYRGTEGLCQLYRFEIDVRSTEEQVAFDDIVGKAAVLSVNTEKGTRWFHGVVSRFELRDQAPGETFFRIELVPVVWMLTHRYGSRIFQNKSVKEIITDVLTKAGIAADQIRIELKGSYEPREYCVQYRETDYNFITRLMEDEGIWWYFEQKQEGHVMVVLDSTAGYAPIEGEPASLTFQPPTGMSTEQEHVVRFRVSQSVRPGAVVLDDFHFENPALDLEAKADAGRDAGLEFSDYPGGYVAQGRGSALAKVRAEEFDAHRIRGVGQSNSYRLAPARTFELTDHPSTPLNDKYVVTSVTHQGKASVTSTTTGSNGRSSVLGSRLHQAVTAARSNENSTIRDLAEGLLQIATRIRTGDPTAHRELTHWLYHAGQVSRDLPSTAAAAGGNLLEALSIPNMIDDLARVSLVEFDAPVYECRFECIPAKVSFRPPRVTPWPKMRGTQTARVVGPSGEEIHTDKYGRVMVQFNWDREGKFDEKSSCWIRVSQGMAGGAYGMLFLPRVGQEVIVDFLEGNPDQPIITGRVYNADHMPPYKLPDEKTKSVIKTHSSKGGGGTNEIRFEDLKDKEQLLLYAQKDLHVRVNNDRVENVDHDHHLTVKENKFELIKKAKNSEVKLDLNEKIGGTKSLAVEGDLGEDIGGNHSDTVGKNYYLKAGKAVVIEAAKEITLKVGGNFVKIDSAGVTILGTQVKINSGGSAGSGSAVSLTAPEAPVDADAAEPGKDSKYSGGGELTEGAAIADAAGHTFEGAEDETETTWIEIELVDEEGGPVPYEAYEITAPDGETIIKGSLDRNGRAHRVVPGKAGDSCKIRFPNLDMEAWERL